MARSEPSDQIAINDPDEEATWHREERLIARDPYQPLIFTNSIGTRGEIKVQRIVLISTVDRKSYTVKIKSQENAFDAFDRNPTTTFQCVL